MSTAYRYNRTVSDQEFVARVRRHKPSSLVPLIASRAATETDPREWLHGRATPPWTYAEIARVSLVLGSENYRPEATYDDLTDCVAACSALGDPELRRGEPHALRNFLLRIGGQQLTYQQVVLHDLARTGAIFARTEPKASHKPSALSAGWDLKLFNCSIREYVGAAFLLHVSAANSSGTFKPDWLDQAQFNEITKIVSGPTLRAVMTTQFVADATSLRHVQLEAEARAGKPTADYRRFGFNPLTTYPVVSGLTSSWQIPVPALLIRKASPLGVYYAGLAKFGQPFANDLGQLFESYIGDQLTAIIGAEVLPEVEYGPSSSRKLSVDWFVIFDECVVLVEVKSTRPTEPIRLGTSLAGDELDRLLSKGVRQLETTAERVVARDPAFIGIPNDRPLVGLLVTMEQFHTVNSPFVSFTSEKTTIPWLVSSAEEIENLARIKDTSVGNLLIQHMTDPDHPGYSLKSMLVDRPLGQNTILHEAWERYPWFTRYPDGGSI